MKKDHLLEVATELLDCPELRVKDACLETRIIVAKAEVVLAEVSTKAKSNSKSKSKSRNQKPATDKPEQPQDQTEQKSAEAA